VCGYWLNNEGLIPGSGISGMLFPSSPKQKGVMHPTKGTSEHAVFGTLSPGVQHSKPDDSSPPSKPTRVRNKSMNFSAAPMERISVKFDIGDLNAVKNPKIWLKSGKNIGFLT